MSESRDLSQYIKKTISLPTSDIEAVEKLLRQIMDELGFHVLDFHNTKEGFSLRGQAGSKSRAFFVTRFLPFGNVAPGGKRFRMSADVALRHDQVDVDIELFLLWNWSMPRRFRF